MYLSFFVSFSELWNSRLDWFRQSVTQGWSLRRETGTPVRPAELEPWAVIWYTAGDRGKDKDEDSFNGGSTSGRGLIRRGDSFRGAPHTRSEVGESIGMLGRGRGETVQRWPTVGFFTSLRPFGAHAIRQSTRQRSRTGLYFVELGRRLLVRKV